MAVQGVARTVRLGDREIVRIGLGTNRLTDTPANAQFIRDAVAAGVGLIDTAHLYTSGSSESTIGKAIGGKPAAVVVATKGGFRPGEGRPDVLGGQIEESLRKLRIDTIDLYYLHRVDSESPFADTLGALRSHVDRGQIAHVGLSHVSVDQIKQARRIVPVSAVQNQFNLSDRESDDVVDYCAEQGIMFVPYYPLHGDHPRLDAIAQQLGATRSQIALAWLLRRAPNIVPIAGTLSVDHVRENVAALDIELSNQEFKALSRPSPV